MPGNTSENMEETKTRAVPSPICVAVAAHKPYRMPDDAMYLPLHVGAALHPGVVAADNAAGDDTGENISRLNDSYSELTGLYWLWKNADARFVGLVHYRRHFGSRGAARRHRAEDRFGRIVGHEELGALLEDHDIVLPKKRDYYIETIYSHYAHTFPGEQLRAAHTVLQRGFPEYLPAFAALASYSPSSGVQSVKRTSVQRLSRTHLGHRDFVKPGASANDLVYLRSARNLFAWLRNFLLFP